MEEEAETSVGDAAVKTLPDGGWVGEDEGGDDDGGGDGDGLACAWCWFASSDACIWCFQAPLVGWGSVCRTNPAAGCTSVSESGSEVFELR